MGSVRAGRREALYFPRASLRLRSRRCPEQVLTAGSFWRAHRCLQLLLSVATHHIRLLASPRILCSHGQGLGHLHLSEDQAWVCY